MTAWSSGSYHPYVLKPAFSYLNWGATTKKWTRGIETLSEGGMRRWIEILEATRPYTQFNSGTTQTVLNDDDTDSISDDEEDVDYRTRVPNSGWY